MLQKHGRKDDRDHENEGGSVNQRVFAKLSVVCDGPVRRDRVEYMQAGEDVCGSVSLVKELDGKSENIVSFKAGGTKQVSVRVNG